MASIEQLEIHSRSYLIRWVNVPTDHTISWSVQPHKKSVNFGLYKHPGSGPLTPNLPSAGTFEVTPQTSSSDDREQPSSQDEPNKRPAPSKNDSNSTAVEKLKNLGLQSVTWVGKCEADKVTTGSYPVGQHGGGMYALIFDNTFSKQISKTVTFVLLTYPSSTPPKTSHPFNPPSTPSLQSSHSLSKALNGELDNKSQESFGRFGRSRASSEVDRPISQPSSEHKYQASNNGFFTGILQKRRRKKHQGFARRFFSLDIKSSTLSYYHDKQSSALRGAVPLSLAVIGANEKRREISVDSGAEVWHLRAGNWKEFYAWKEALEQASATPAAVDSETLVSESGLDSSSPCITSTTTEEQEWVRAEALVGRIVGTRDAVRRLAAQHQDHHPHTPSFQDLGIHDSSVEPSPVDSHGGEYFAERERKPFWKRKPSNSGGNLSPNIAQRNVSGQLAIPSANGRLSTPSPSRGADELRSHCRVLLKDLDSVVADFSTLIAESKQRRQNAQRRATHRASVDSSLTQEFFDAESGEGRASVLFQLPDSDDNDDGHSDDEFVSDAESSDDEEAPPGKRLTRHVRTDTSLFPSTPKSLSPLPIPQVTHRQTVPKATMLPPSLIGFFRKNMGKDLSTISMPVSANEPLSLLQRSAEILEYAPLLTTATSFPAGSPHALAYITAFALSGLSSNRVPARAIRKPFNPMLGETFELVRAVDSSTSYRLISEKVSHRPVQMALQAESSSWTLSFAPRPTQKFWGKSVEIIQEGTVRVILHSTGECFSWTPATCTLKNLLAGEKYIEPFGTLTVLNETSPEKKATAAFKAKGMFGGRSEDVHVSFAQNSRMSLQGTWTKDLTLHDDETGKKDTIWCAGELVDDAPARYGFTRFAAGLNEVTSTEKGKVPVTDSRFRRDQRAAEEGRLDQAERLKAEIEEGQRERRRDMEAKGEGWEPRWFTRKEGSGDVWVLRKGERGYWEERERGGWSGIVDVLGVGEKGSSS